MKPVGKEVQMEMEAQYPASHNAWKQSRKYFFLSRSLTDLDDFIRLKC